MRAQIATVNNSPSSRSHELVVEFREVTSGDKDNKPQLIAAIKDCELKGGTKRQQVKSGLP